MDENIQAEDRLQYEIGFHLVSSLSEEQLTASFASIKELIEKNGGVIDGERFPVLRALAYTMYKKTPAGYSSFQNAYFGWIFFSADPSALSEIKKAIDLKEEVLRYLLIKDPITKEPKLEGAPEPLSEESSFEVVEKPAEVVEAVVEEPVEVSEQELEESIDKLTGDEEVKKE